ncbi:hypothetical protein BH11PLA2_BH11PLA2_14150 [soil metagenome]
MPLAALVLTALPLRAQTPPVVPPTVTGFESRPLVAPPPTTVQVLPLNEGPSQTLIQPGVMVVEDRCPWQFDVILGAPTALRLQHQIGDSRVWWEVGAGGYLIFPTVFAGLRTETRLLETRNHTIAVRPGIDVYYLGRYDDRGHYRRRYSIYDDLYVPDFGAVAIDIDFQWRARFSEHFHGLVGLKLGCGAAFGSVSGPMPIVGMTFGGNF